MVEFEKIICKIGNQITLILKLEGILNQYESNTEFDLLVAEICNTYILNYKFQFFRVRHSCANPNETNFKLS